MTNVRMHLKAGVLTSCFLISCTTSKSSSYPTVANGIEIEFWQFPQVARIEGAGHKCSGTFLGSRLLLTAAHCINDINATIEVHTMSWGMNPPSAHVIQSEKIIRNPLFNNPSSPDEWRKNGKHDLVLIVLKEENAPSSSAIYWRQPVLDEEVILVGYGYADWPGTSGFGIKRWGYNKVAAIEEGTIKVIGASHSENIVGVNVGGTRGDSGGPLFIDGFLAGVTSWGGVSESYFGDLKNHMFYVNIMSDESKIFLKSTHKEAQQLDPTIYMSGSQYLD